MEIKLCECGCGEPAPIAKKTGKGYRKGQPLRFINWHSPQRPHGANGKANHFFKHGDTGSPEHRAWLYARTRCHNSKRADWKDYGGRGIKMLFTSFEQFFAELGRKPTPQHSLDRFPNPDGHYEPGNVRWATPSEQNQNKRPRKKAA